MAISTKNLHKYAYLIKDMGLTYFFNRTLHLINVKSGLIKRKNEFKSTQKLDITLIEWRRSNIKYIIPSKSNINFQKNRNPELSYRAIECLNGNIVYFNSFDSKLLGENKWHTNPASGFTFPKNQHWLDINEFTVGNDIKYVWERSRFCFIYDVIRYDYHFDADCCEFVINEITNWIDENPIHCGPNYISGQEIALRILNWIFALKYYADNYYFTEAVWQKIICSIYDQIKHIAVNLNFAQQLVRNNHIITEAAALFVFATLFPKLKESTNWENSGRKILETEGSHQIFNDGTYLQYSMNYHRVVIQVYNLVLKIGELNNKPFSIKIKKRLGKSLQFLLTCTNIKTGELPNYGANDGSLFFPLNNNSYSDFRPQLQALAHTLQLSCFLSNIFEDTNWINGNYTNSFPEIEIKLGANNFLDSGYYTINENETFTFIRCGKHKSRPSQADNLHVDLWHKSINIMRDAGTYQYNTDAETTKYFFGTASHNTIMLGNYDQMVKGPRFLWFYHSKLISASLIENEENYSFSGTIKAFRQTGKWHIHERVIQKLKHKADWLIADTVQHSTNLLMHQIWHPHESFSKDFRITAIDEFNNTITPTFTKAYYSPTYGKKVVSDQITFTTLTKKITTHITAIV